MAIEYRVIPRKILAGEEGTSLKHTVFLHLYKENPKAGKTAPTCQQHTLRPGRCPMTDGIQFYFRKAK